MSMACSVQTSSSCVSGSLSSKDGMSCFVSWCSTPSSRAALIRPVASSAAAAGADQQRISVLCWIKGAVQELQLADTSQAFSAGLPLQHALPGAQHLKLPASSLALLHPDLLHLQEPCNAGHTCCVVWAIGGQGYAPGKAHCVLVPVRRRRWIGPQAACRTLVVEQGACTCTADSWPAMIVNGQ